MTSALIKRTPELLSRRDRLRAYYSKLSGEIWIVPNVRRVAELFNTGINNLTLVRPPNHQWDTIAVYCRHNHFTDVKRQIAYRDITVMLEILLDELGICYGFAGRCPLSKCRRVYYAEPTVTMLELVGLRGRVLKQ